LSHVVSIVTHIGLADIVWADVEGMALFVPYYLRSCNIYLRAVYKHSLKKVLKKMHAVREA
jgi:hypothetical protein